MRRALRGLSAALGQLAENAPAARLRAASSLAPEQPPAVTRLTFPAGLAATAHSPSRPPLQPPALEPHTALSPPVDSAADERAAEADSRAARRAGARAAVLGWAFV